MSHGAGAQRKARGAHSFERVSVTQVEAGPQDGTLLVTWQPVALNGSAVTGYAVYADGKKVTDVDSPTGDHALVDIHKLMGLNPKHITVRTKSRESQSGDSCATAIPCSVLRGQSTSLASLLYWPGYVGSFRGEVPFKLDFCDLVVGR